MKLVILLLASLCGLALGLFRIDPLVSTKAGLIKGLKDENGFSKFLGVPYGKINHSNIFGAAEPQPVFDDIFEAYDDSNICIQVDRLSGDVKGTLECLTLNIYVPDSAHSKNQLPVMVWIHGGGFVEGYGREAGFPLPLLKDDVIVVTINYRLGVFGFMCLDIPEVPGNTGLKDQVLALRWVNDNINAFGGDTNQITVFGQSAGAMSVNLHLFSTYEKLFDRAIIQSGTANSYWATAESDNTLPIRLAEELGLNTTDVYEALTYLSQINPETLGQVSHYFNDKKVLMMDQPYMKPCVEKKFDGVENFLTDYPMNIKSTKPSIPVIIGYTNNEYYVQYDNIGIEYFESYDFRNLFELGFDINDDLNEVLDVIKHFYTGDEDEGENKKSAVIDFESDFIFNHPSQRMAQQLLKNGAKAVYYYVFSYEGNEANKANKTWVGATHGEELPHLFDMTLSGEQITSEDQLVTDRLSKLWTNFVKYGDPTPTTSDLLPVKWTPITNTSLPYLDIALDLELKNRPFHNRMAFWDMFYTQYARYQKGFKSDG